MTTMVKLGSALGQVTLDEFLTWSSKKQAKNLMPNRNIPTKEHIAKVAAVNRGKPAWNKGICHLSDEAKKSIGDARRKAIAEGNCIAGKYKRSEESKIKMREKSSVPVMTPDGIFPSKGDAADYYGIHRNNFRLRMMKFPEQYYALIERNSKGNSTKGKNRKGGRK